MHWLLQSNLSTEEGQRPFVDALDNLIQQESTASWSFVKLVPFAGTVEPDIDYSLGGRRKVFPLGSTSMTTASRIYNWTPGVILDPVTFRFEAWKSGWGKQNLINGDAHVCRFGDAAANTKVFMRPCQDLKAFTGLTINPDELQDWQRRVKGGEQSTRTELLSEDTAVIVAPVKVIYREWRFFVVDGQVVSGSQYAHLGRRDRCEQIDSDVWSYAKQVVKIWTPAPCFVLDIGETNDGLAIVEVNTINSSGVYESDFASVVLALERFYEQTT